MLDEGRPPFSYDLSWRIAFPLHKGEISLAAALEACRKQKHPLGARCNAEVVTAMWEEAQRVSYMCHPLKDRYYPIRRDLTIPVCPRFYMVQGEDIKLFWLQPWKTFAFGEEQLGILASVIRDTFAVDDFEGAGLHLIDTSAKSEDADRSVQVLGFDDLPMLSDAALKAAFDRFALAWDRFVANRKPREERPHRQPERPEGLFGSE